MTSHQVERIYQWLDDHKIDCVRYDHEPVYTVEQADMVNHHIDGISAKTLLLYTEKSKQLYLLSLEGHKKIEQARIKALLGERVRFADADILQRVLDVQPGSVSPLGLIFDTDFEIQAYIIDADIVGAEYVTWHPNSNDQTLQFSQAMNQKILDTISHNKIIY